METVITEVDGWVVSSMGGGLATLMLLLCISIGNDGLAVHGFISLSHFSVTLASLGNFWSTV